MHNDKPFSADSFSAGGWLMRNQYHVLSEQTCAGQESEHQ